MSRFQQSLVTTLRTVTAEGLIESIQEMKTFADLYILQLVAKEAEPTYLRRDNSFLSNVAS